jgi:putative mRNA 3-end processing factor
MDVVTVTESGLYCPGGDFYIDPWRPVARAVVTHAHGDHARGGSEEYIAADCGIGLLRHRLGPDARICGRSYTEPFVLGGARVSLHAAGHVLGSAQVRIETDAGVWVVTGDYKRAPDPTCAAFEPLAADVLISEATFALPCYRWPDTQTVIAEIHEWWMRNRRAGRASALFCYALGKAQRVLAELARLTDEAVYLHGAVTPLVEEYRRAGVRMLPTAPVVREAKADYAGALIMAPPSAAGTPWMRRFGDAATGFCSGWMRIRGARRRRGYDRGFVLSDHADWPELLQTVTDSGARRVLLTHGYTHALERHLREQGIDAAALRTAYGEEE